MREVQKRSLRDSKAARQARTQKGTACLQICGEVRTPTGSKGLLVVEPVLGDGFCFLRALCREVSDAGGVEHLSVAIFTLAEIAYEAVTQGTF